MSVWPSAVSTAGNLYTTVNALRTTLAVPCGTGDVTLTLASTTNFPTAGAVTIENEVVFYTSISGTILMGCTRGADGTIGATHSANVPVGATVVAYHVNAVNAEIIALEQNLSSRIGLGTGSLQAVDGAVGTPAFSFASHTNMGIYQISGNMSLVTGGVDRFIISNSILSCLNPLGQQGGTAANPTYTWSNDLDTGLWESALDEVSITCGGTTRFTFAATAHTSTVPIRVPAGSTSNVAISPAADINTGLVWNSADNVSLISGGGGFAGGEVNVTSTGISINSNGPYALGINGSLAGGDYLLQIANGASDGVSVLSATSGRATSLNAAFGPTYVGSRCGQPAADMANIEFGGTNLSAAAVVTQVSAPLYFGTNQTEAAHIDTSQVWTFVHPMAITGLTALTVPYLDSSKKFASSAVTPTELGYVSGVTSAIQTQLNGLLSLGGGTLTGALTINPVSNQIVLGGVSAGHTVTISSTAPATNRTYTIPDAGGAANFLLSGSGQIVNADINATAAIALSKLAALGTAKALQSNASTGFIEASSVTNTELGYVSGVTSAIQTQLTAKATDSLVVHLAGTESITGNKTISATATFSQAAGNPCTKFSPGTSDGTNYQNMFLLGGAGGSTVGVEINTATQATITTAKTIYTRDAGGALLFVYGSDGAGNDFFDEVFAQNLSGGTATALHSLTSKGSPTARTYSQSGGNVQLAMASGTYTVRVFVIDMAPR